MTVYFEELSLGQFAEHTKTVTDQDIVGFAEITGDNNPVHLDEAYAKTTPFQGRIAHGILSVGFISTVLGTQLPGNGTIYLSQTAKFKAPVRLGDTVTARATVKELTPGKNKVVLDTVCFVNGKVVLEGEAVVLAPAKPAA